MGLAAMKKVDWSTLVQSQSGLLEWNDTSISSVPKEAKKRKPGFIGEIRKTISR